MGETALRTGFIGLGNMGRGMARNLVRAGYATTVLDVRPEPMAELVADGAQAAQSGAEVAAAADLVCIAVFDEAQVRDTVLGDTGVLAGARPGTVVAVHATISPGLARELAALAAPGHVDVLDVAMTGGGDVAADAGQLTFMVGGDESALARARAAFDAMAKSVFHVGPIGAGVSAKIISNFLGASNVALVREALRIAAGAGIDAKTILGIVEDGGVGSSWVSNNWQRIRTQERNYTTGKDGFVAMWSKDMRLAVGLGDANGVPTPLASFMVSDVLPGLSVTGLSG
jgi:3-hydroxyisobutyrate dehydrogenase-like beta-hydroxyacid dehydrogenase